MGLFDDILKKPTAPAGQVSAPTDPLMGSGSSGAQGGGQATGSGGTTPVIVKSETSTVFGPNTEADAIRSQNAPPSIPTVHAEEDSSSVLMPAAPASTAIAPVAPLQEPMVVAPMADAPVSQPLASPAPIEFGATPAPQPVTAIAATSNPSTPAQDALQIPAGPSLFDHIMREESPAAEVSPIAAAADVPAALVQAPVSFQFENTTPQNAPTQTPAPSASVEVPANEFTPSSLTPMTPVSNYATPREFIEKSLENIDVMLETIDGRHSAKMTEAEGYRMEKMRFAELEKNAYAEAEIMDRERDHTLRMKSIFERELETDEANRTKKTVAHQELHAEKHVHAHKRHVQEEEEDLIAAS